MKLVTNDQRNIITKKIDPFGCITGSKTVFRKFRLLLLANNTHLNNAIFCECRYIHNYLVTVWLVWVYFLLIGYWLSWCVIINTTFLSNKLITMVVESWSRSREGFLIVCRSWPGFHFIKFEGFSLNGLLFFYTD